MDKKRLILGIAGAVVALAVAAALFFYGGSSKDKPAESQATSSDYGIPKNAFSVPEAVTQPLQDMPDINPASRANPFKKVKTNPFE